MATPEESYRAVMGDTDLLTQEVKKHPAYLNALATGQPAEFKIGPYKLRVTANGEVHASTGSVWKPLLAAGAVFGGGLALGALGPAAAASGSSGAAQGAAASGASGAAGIPTIPSTTYGSLAPGVGTGAATGAGILGTKLGWGDLAKFGMQGLASWQGSRAANNAAQQQVDAANRALEFAKQVYDEQRANQAPFIGVGHGSANTLAHLMGLSPQQPMPGGPLSSLGGQR